MWLLPEQARAIAEGCGLAPAPYRPRAGAVAHLLRIIADPYTGAVQLELGELAGDATTPVRAPATVQLDARERAGESHARALLLSAGLGSWLPHAERITRLAGAFADDELLLLEVLLLPGDSGPSFGSVRALCDENAAFRNERVAAMVQAGQPEVTRRLKSLGIDYVRLDGPVGLISVGAGETMAAMDLLDEASCPAACFLDVSGGFGADAMTAAFRQVSGLTGLRAVLVNVFGGLTRVDRVAESILAALDALGPLPCPLVVRLEGTDAERGRQLVGARGIRCERTLRGAIAAAVAVASGGAE